MKVAQFFKVKTVGKVINEIRRVDKPDSDLSFLNGTSASNDFYEDKNGNPKVRKVVCRWSYACTMTEANELQIKTGDFLELEGDFSQETWEDDNGKHYAYKLIANSLKKLI